jgi:predicted permease
MSIRAGGLVRLLRKLLRAPLFTIVTVLTIGVGIGANTAIFSMIYGVLLKPLPFPEPERLVSLRHTAPDVGLQLFNQSPATYFTYRDENKVFTDVGMWSTGADVPITGGGEPERVQKLQVTEETLRMLGVQPLLGRIFTKDDDSPGAPDRAILPYGYWQRRFGGASDIIGHTIIIDGTPHEIIGVLPQSFKFLATNPAVVLPFRFRTRDDPRLGSFSYNAIARLKPGVTVAQANQDVARMIPMVFERYPPKPGDQKINLGPLVRPLSAEVIGGVGRVLWILLGSVGIVLLIACANVANLFLVRAEGRRQEFAIRAALGGTSRQLARELLGESLALAVLGGLLGLGLARAGVALLVWLAPSGLPRVEEVGAMGLHPLVLLFTLGLAILTGLLFGLVAVIKFGTPSPSAMREGGRSASEGPARHRARHTLVVAQIALALVLLIVSGLMIRTFVALRDVNPGFTNPEEVQTFRVATPMTLIPDQLQAVRTHQQIMERLKQLQGVKSVGLASSMTMDGIFFNGSIYVEGIAETDDHVRPFRRHKFISPGYFETMGNRVLIGRTVTWNDIYEDTLVAVVSEKLAREYWKNPADAIGKHIRVSPKQPWREIIGVVGNEQDDGLDQAAPTIVYWPMAMVRFLDEPYMSRTMSYAVRSSRIHAPGFLREIQQRVWSVNPNLALGSIQTLDHIRSESMARTSFALIMLLIAAGVALLLGMVGLYGVIAYVASQRTREIGIRIALGAQRRDVSLMFLRQGLVLTAIGVALGLGGALALTRVMSSLFFGVSAMDPITYVAVAALLGVIALSAIYLPARRASRTDPIRALRADP